MNELYLLCYYDWNCESGITLGLFKTLTDVQAYLIDEYEGRFDFSTVVEPEMHKYSSGIFPYTKVDLDGYDYGKCIYIEKVKVE